MGRLTILRVDEGSWDSCPGRSAAVSRSGGQKAVVALANKNARILWALFVRGRPFDARHVSAKPDIVSATV